MYCAALADHGIVHPFPIQEMAIPIALRGTDMVGQARTGTGKTLAFGLPLLQSLDLPDSEEAAHGTSPQALVVTPTRELAHQVGGDIASAAAHSPTRILTVYGGTPYEPQLDALASGIDVVVGTPGRLLDLVQRRALNLSRVHVVVLDEADEMLDLGFLPDVERLISKTPKSRQTLLFSATMPAAVVALARMHLNQPVNVRAESHDAQLTVPDTTQFVYQAHDLDKPEIVGRILRAPECTRTMIFTRTKRAAQRLADELEDRGFKATSIHGDLNQVAREKALKKFRDGKVSVLVATDVAARGIDITDVSHVINYECPDSEMTYVHRIGRTGRAGAKGTAVTLVDWADVTRWKVINRALELDFPEIPETYSTSAHLFSDLGIPEGTRGRLVDAPPREHRDHHKDGHHKDHGERKDRPQRERTRRRLRNGEFVDGAAGAAGAAGDAPDGAPAPAGDAEAASTGASRNRRRRRRRSGGEGGQGGTPSEAS